MKKKYLKHKMMIIGFMMSFTFSAFSQGQGVVITPIYKNSSGCNANHGRLCSFPPQESISKDGKIEAKLFLSDGRIIVEFYKNTMDEKTKNETFGKDFYKLEEDIIIENDICKKLLKKDTTIVWNAGYYPVLEDDDSFKLIFKL